MPEGDESGHGGRVNPSPEAVPVRVRIARGDRLLGVLAVELDDLEAAASGLDLVVVPAGLVEAASALTMVPVVVLVDLTERFRVVASPAEASRAFASGVQVVLYDLTAVRDAAYAALERGRPGAADPDRPPLVLLSGMLGDATVWDGLSTRVGARVLPWPVRIDTDDSVGELADSVLAAAPPTFLLGGHSLGGIVGLEVLRRAPQRVLGILLVNTSGRAPTQAQYDGWRRTSDRVTAGEFDAVATELARATLAPNHRSDEALVSANAAMARTVGPDGMLRQLAAQATRTYALDVLEDAELPLLAVSGELDEICPPELQGELVARVAGARHVTLPGSGHMAPLEEPGGLTDAVLDWLREDIHPTR